MWVTLKPRSKWITPWPKPCHFYLDAYAMTPSRLQYSSWYVCPITVCPVSQNDIPVQVRSKELSKLVCFPQCLFSIPLEVPHISPNFPLSEEISALCTAFRRRLIYLTPSQVLWKYIRRDFSKFKVNFCHFMFKKVLFWIPCCLCGTEMNSNFDLTWLLTWPTNHQILVFVI